jgi:hypothetical protein
MSLVKGIDAIKKAQKEVEKKMKGTGGDNFYLKSDGDSALIRFLTNGDELIAGQFHRVSKMSNNGNKYWDEMFCSGDDDCPYCNSDEPDEIKTSFRFIAWVWVHEKRHEEQLDEEWEAKEVDDELKYIEKINKPMLFRHGYNLSIIITALYTKYGSLIDRDFEIARSGSGLNTRYSVLPEEKSKMPAEVKTARESIGKDLKGLEEIVLDKAKEKEHVKDIMEEDTLEEVPF